MVYKKYTYKKGKRFGPYLYENKRVGDRIVTKYLGPAPRRDNKKLFSYVGIGFVLVLFVFLAYSFVGELFGILLSPAHDYSQVVLGSFVAGESISGRVNLFLRAGELIPAQSEVVLSYGGVEDRRILSDLVVVESVSGGFYLESVDISGSGEGYGLIGKKTEFPEISFELMIIDINDSIGGGGGGNESGRNDSGVEEPIINDSVIEEPEINDSVIDEPIINESEGDEPIVNDTDEDGGSDGGSDGGDAGGEGVVEVPVVEGGETGSESGSGVSESGAGEGSVSGSETSIEEDSGGTSVSSEESVDSESSESEASSEGSSETSGDSGDSESGESSSSDGGGSEGSGGGDGGGSDSGGAESGEEGGEPGLSPIVGSVKKGNDFVYPIEDGQSVEIVEGSVRVDGNETNESVLSLRIVDGEVVVSTEYEVTLQGFGEEFFSDEIYEIGFTLQNYSLIAVNDSVLDVGFVFSGSRMFGDREDVLKTAEKIEENVSLIGGNITDVDMNESNASLIGGNITDVDMNESNASLVVSNGSVIGNGTGVSGLGLVVLGQPVEVVERISVGEIGEGGILTVEIPKRADKIKVFREDSDTGRKIKVRDDSENDRDATDEDWDEWGEEIVAGEIDSTLQPTDNIPPTTGPDEVVNDKDWEGNEESVGEGIGDDGADVNGVTEESDRENGETVEGEDGEGEILLSPDGVASAGDTVVLNVVPEGASEEEKLSVPVKVSNVDDFVEFSFELPGPKLEKEEITSRGKKIYISSEFDFADALLFSDIPQEFNVRDAEKVRIRWVEGDMDLSILNINDTNNDSVYDYIEWIAPHLSNQTYEIIVIVKAEHLDSNRSYISDIFEDVKELDGNWSETIPSGDYVRVVFEINLTSDRDITVYPREVSGNPRIEIYERDGSEMIAEFESLNDEEYNKVYLDNLVGEQDTFDLLILDGDVEFEHIIDPSQISGWYYPVVTGSPLNDWTNGANIKADDGSYATSTVVGNKLDSSTYNVVLPVGVFVQGILFEVDGRIDQSLGSATLGVDLSWDGGTTYTTKKTNGFFSTSDSTKTYGSYIDTWGRLWKRNDFSKGNFRARLEFVNTEGPTFNPGVDVIRMKINYTTDLFDLPLVTCGDLTIVNATYVLQNNIIFSGNCFSILGDYVTLDGNGYTITGDGGGVGVEVRNSNNTKVKNITIVNFNEGVKYAGSVDSKVFDSKFFNNTRGIFLNESFESRISNNTVESSKFGIDIDNGGFNLVEDNIVNLSSDLGISSLNSTNNNYTGNWLGNNTLFGFHFVDKSHDGVMYSNYVNGSEVGVLIANSSNGIVTNNTFGLNKHGVLIQNGSNNTLVDNVISHSTEGHGVKINLLSNEVFLQNNNVSYNFISGVFVENSNGTVIIGSNISKNGMKGVHFYRSSHNFLGNNIVSNNSQEGIYFYLGENETLAGNIVRDSLYGVSLEKTNISNLSWNVFKGNDGSGMLINYSNLNDLYRNNISFNRKGMEILFSIGNTAGYNELSSSSEEGIYFDSSIFNSVRHGLVKGSGRDALHLKGSSYNNSFTNVNLSATNAAHEDFEIVTSGIGGNSLNDMPHVGRYRFAGNKIIINYSDLGVIEFLADVSGSGSNLSDDIRIGDNLVVVESASNNGLNKSANVTLYGIGERGFKYPSILKDGVECGQSVCTEQSFLTDDTVKFKVSGWSGYEIGNRVELISGCGILNEFNKEYVLTEDATYGLDCFLINKDNITLNGNGHTITYTGVTSHKGVRMDIKSGIEIKNLNFVGNANKGWGIGFSGLNDSLLVNNSFSDFLYAITSTNIIENNNVTVAENYFSSSDHGISVSRFNDSEIYNNFFYDNGEPTFSSVSLRFKDSYGSLIFNNTFVDERDERIYLDDSGGIEVVNNSFRGDGFTAIKFDNTNVSNVSGNNISSSESMGIEFNFESDANLIFDNWIYSTTLGGIVLSGGSEFNLIYNNTIINSSGDGITFAGSSFNKLYGNYLENTTLGYSIGSSSMSNEFRRGVINGSKRDAIRMSGASNNNNFTNVSILNTNKSHFDIFFNSNYTVLSDMPQIENYSITPSGLVIYFRNSEFGEVRFIQGLSGSGEYLTNDVRIGDNFVAVDSNSINFGGLNKSANVTLYGIGERGFENVQVLRDGASCGDYCHNFTVLDVDEVRFNVTGWSEYSVGDSVNVWTCFSLDRFDNPNCWTLGRVPIRGDLVVFNGTGTGDVNVTNNTMPQDLFKLLLDIDYTGSIYFEPLFAEGDWGGLAEGTQEWNVTRDINISGGTVYVSGDYPRNIIAEGQGQIWRTFSGNISIGSGAVIDGVGRGFPEMIGPGASLDGGGSHGGYGGAIDGLLDVGEAIYGNASAPTSLGSGGSLSGAKGGSAIKLESPRIIKVEGAIRMDGSSGDSGGAGGSIWLNGSEVNGSGIVSASGMNGQTDELGGAGGGGRIRFDFISLSYDGVISADSGFIDESTSRPGTFSFTDNTYPRDWKLNGNIGLAGGNYTVLGDFTVPNGTFLGVHPVNNVADDSGQGVVIDATGEIVIEKMGVIDGEDEGFLGRNGPGGPSADGKGGTFGGQGEDNSLDTYGDESSPLSLGSGGSGINGGGDLSQIGAGAIRLSTPGSITITGNISMSDRSYGDFSGTASGGSIWLDAGVIVGNGNLEAIGGRGVNYLTGGRDGGGGRIALASVSFVDFNGTIVVEGDNFGGGVGLGSGGGSVFVNSTGSVSGYANISAKGFDGGNITIAQNFLNLSGRYSASSIDEISGGENAFVYLVFSDCSSDFESAVFNPNPTYQTSCGLEMSIGSPINNSNFNEDLLDLNVSLNRIGSWCGYSLDGFSNVSMSRLNDWFFNDLTVVADGNHTAIFNCNDTGNNFGYTNFSYFLIDTLIPDVNFTDKTPEDGSIQNANSIYVDVLASDESEIYGFTSFDDSVIGWWRLDGNATDSSGRGNDGTVLGAVQTLAGRFGRAYDFNGVTEHIDIGTNADFNFERTDSFSLTTWVRLNELPPPSVGRYRFFGRQSDAGSYNRGYIIQVESNGKIRWAIVSDSSPARQAIVETSGSPITEGAFYHVVATYDGSSSASGMNIYVNGISEPLGFPISDTLGSFSIKDSNIPFQIGIRDSVSSPLNGTIDEALVFNRILTPDEVATLYNASAQFFNNYTSISLGVHTFQSFAVDEGGNLNKTEKRTVTYDPPPTLFIESPQNNSNLNNVSVSFNVSLSETGITCVFSLDGGPNITMEQFSSTYFNYTLVVSEGEHSVVFACTDVLGQIGASTVSNFLVDETIPWISYIPPTPVDGEKNFGSSIYVNVDASDANDIYGFTDFNNSLVAWWRLDENITDSSGNGNDGVSGGSAIPTSAGRFGGAYKFEGDDEEIIIPISSKFDDMPGYTFSLWFKAGTEGGYLFSKRDATPAACAGGIWRVSADSSGKISWLKDAISGSVDKTSVAGTYTLDSWTHLVVTWDGGLDTSGAHMYVDGTEVLYSDEGSGSGGFLSDAGCILRIGKRYNELSFNGTIDEILIFNRSLTSDEVKTMYDASSQFFNDYINLEEEFYSFQSFVVDEGGNMNKTEVIGVGNRAPLDPNPHINSSDASNRSSQKLHCFGTINDLDGDLLNVTVEWYKESLLHLNEVYFVNLPSGSHFNGTLEWENTTKGDNWTCAMQVFDGIDYSNLVENLTFLNVLNSPPVVTLETPVDDFVTTDRTPTFTWSVFDYDGDVVTGVEINLTCLNSEGDGCSELETKDRRNASLGGEETTYTIPVDLLYLFDYGNYYNWSVRANDSESVGEEAQGRFIKIQALVSLNLLVDTVDFGSKSNEDSDDTSDDLPPPFLLENDGTVYADVKVSAAKLWESRPIASSDYQFKIDWSGEIDSFDFASSTTSFTNVPIDDPTGSLAIVALNYSDASDSCEIDLGINVPTDESGGSKSSIFTFIGELGE